MSLFSLHDILRYKIVITRTGDVTTIHFERKLS